VSRHLKGFAAIAAALALMLLCAGRVNAHGTTLKLRHSLPADSAFHTQFLVPWTQKVESDAAGHLRFQLFPATPGDAPQQLYDQVKDGSADIVWTVAGAASEHFPAAAVFELPFMANSAQGSSRALWEYLQANDLAKKEFGDVRLIAVHQHDAPQFHLAAKPIQSLADLNGLKIHTTSRITGKLLAALGATPVEMALDGVPDALSKGTLDGTVLPWAMLPALKLHEKVKYHAEIDPKTRRLYSAVFVFAMNPSTYKSLPDDMRKVITANSGADTSAWIGRVFDESATSARKLATDRGNVINVLPAQEFGKWEQPAQALVDDWIKELDKRGLSGKELVDSARSALAEYDPPK
jgi:TRAP-type transport system periplasmic protein